MIEAGVCHKMYQKPPVPESLYLTLLKETMTEVS